MEKLHEWFKAERGRLTNLSRHLGISPGAIPQWTMVPADKLIAIEAFTGIPRQELRPDLFEGLICAKKGRR